MERERQYQQIPYISLDISYKRDAGDCFGHILPYNGGIRAFDQKNTATIK